MKKILVIEDNNDIRENLCEILKLANYTTYEAENGKIGLERAKEENPDLIICDVMMPILDGFGVLRILNRDPQLMHIPFMFLTAKADKSDFRRGMGLGADDYITKPFDDVELMDAIEMRLKKSAQLSNISNTEEGIRTFFSEPKAEEALKELCVNKEKRSYDKNSSIYEVGQYPKYLFFVISGYIKATQMTEGGKELIINVYKEGDFLGLLSLIQDMPYQENAICIESCDILLIPTEEFRLLMFSNRDVSAKLFHMIAQHASHTESQLLDLAFSSVRRKVANAILAFSAIKGSAEFNVPREDLAALAGAARESVIRTLTEFKNEGLIELNKGKIGIIDQPSLEEMPQ